MELRRGTLVLSVLSQPHNPEYGYSLVQKLEQKNSIIEVTSAFITVFVVGALLEGLFTPTVDGGFFKTLIEVFVDILIAVIQGVMQGFLWVIMTFVLLERAGVNEGEIPFAKKKWFIINRTFANYWRM